MKSENYFDQIESYFLKRLSGDDRQRFEKELAVNPELKRELKLYQLSHLTIRRIKEQGFRKEMEAWWETPSESRESVSQVRRLLGSWRVVAAAALVIIFGGWFLFHWAANAYSNEQIATQYFEETFSQVVPRGPEIANNPLSGGKKALQEERFQDAIPLFRQIQPQDPFFHEGEFYLGYALYHQGDYEASAAAYKIVAQSGDPRFARESEWYQALSLLAAGETGPTFRQLFDRILTDENHDFNGIAKDLEKDLDGFWRKLAN